MNPRRRIRDAFLLWAVLPLAVLSGAPRHACLCSNGEVGVACRNTASSPSCCEPANFTNLSVCKTRSNQLRDCCAHRKPIEPVRLTNPVEVCHCTHFIVVPEALPAPVQSHDRAIHIAADADAEFVAASGTFSDATGYHPSPPIAGRDVLIALARWIV